MRWFGIIGIVLTFLTSVFNAVRIRSVHLLVNSQLTKVLERVGLLERTLQDADIDVPSSTPEP